ncbi:hypothetical protein [Nitrosomonas sp.]|uniref:IS66 family insertion sequence element accessory protein TnpA n=1 Tax=Nitrosomonas sp. TaxID=42353 RepID=UPI00272043A8|nr:hypothetical protein [Nitrosomonas sp.]MDO8895901.1 hypothetical protein [Nitrosomonas sp.]
MSSSEIRRIHIEAWQNSGMSQAAYCREHVRTLMLNARRKSLKIEVKKEQI